MQRTLARIAIAAVGLAFIGLAFLLRLFTVAPTFDRMTNDFRPEMRPAEIARLQHDLSSVAAVQSEFTTRITPLLGTALNVTPDQLAATMQQQFPAVAAGMAAIPGITGRFTTVVDTLDRDQGRFAKADAIPTKSVSPAPMPWAFLTIGVLALVAAALIPRAGAGAKMAIGLGALLLVATVVLSLPTKASAADRMNADFKPIYTADLVSTAKRSMVIMNAMVTEMQTTMIPTLARTLQLPPDQLQALLAANFPATAAALSTMPESFARFDALVAAFDRSLGNYNRIKSASFVPIVWFITLAGALLVVAGWLSRPVPIPAP